MSIGEFFGFGGYTRQAEGYMSWQHLLFVSVLTAVMIFCAVIIGKKRKNSSVKNKNRVLIVSAFLIDGFEIAKIIIQCFRSHNALDWLYELPLFLCSIQLITIPLAAFSKGRIKEASLDFVTVFGLLGAILGTYFAGNNYSVYPVLSVDNVFSGITHCISGFVSLYVIISGMVSMKKRNIGITVGILSGFCVAAYVANLILDYNYMFLFRGDGTPYDIIYNLVNGNKVAYPILVVLLFVVYIIAYYSIFYSIQKKGNNPKQKEKELLEVK
ncbi:MAG: YwaF family protein [Acutalibacteraceae bacterium]|nr:YwaF family protein [Acutalibacteraceae bacterium]